MYNPKLDHDLYLARRQLRDYKNKYTELGNSFWTRFSKKRKIKMIELFEKIKKTITSIDEMEQTLYADFKENKN